MSDPSPHDLRFQRWLESGEPASNEHFFVYHHWLQALQVPVLAHRCDGRIVFLNAAAAALFGRRRRDIREQPLSAVIADPGWLDRYDAALDELDRDAPSFSIEHDYVDSSGRPHELEWLVSVQRDMAGQPGLVWAFLRDVSATRALQRAADLASHKLAESNRDLEDFAHIASHDLREPLRKVSAFSDRLRNHLGDDADERALDYLDRIEDASGRMQTLIADLLEFSRVTTAGRPLTPVELESVIGGVLSDLEVAIEESAATVEVGKLPVIDADEPQLRQLFQNLIGNALKFRTADRRPVISIDAAILGSRWLVSVSDNGIGFEPQYAEKIFTVFQRLHGRGTYEGTGVGLAVCRRIVERHNGTIRAISSPGEGATFLIDLPRSVQKLPAAA